MNENELCAEKHKRLDEKIQVHDTRLNNHGERIDKLEQRGAAVDTKIDNLCEQIANLVTTMRWFIGLSVGSLASFFFYAVQQGVFK